MPTRKRKISDDMETNKKTKKPRIKFDAMPAISTIKELIELGQTYRYYKNINNPMLWNILPHLEELDRMVGMEELKETIFFQIVYYLQGMNVNNENNEYLHTLIVGPPGHGKTIVAEIIGKIYRSMGVLSEDGTFTKAVRSDFIGQYLGSTAIKTSKLLKSCIGGVLFIDEIYSLAPQDKDKDSFSKEAIDTLNAFLSEHKNDFCCIIAGYEHEVRNCFFAMNKGLERRFPWTHKIKEYKESELAKIFVKFVEDINWNYSFEISDLEKILKDNKIMFKNAGGDVETFVSKCKMLHSLRVFSLDPKHKFILTLEDLKATVAYNLKHDDRKVDEPPFGMYL